MTLLCLHPSVVVVVVNVVVPPSPASGLPDQSLALRIQPSGRETTVRSSSVDVRRRQRRRRQQPLVVVPCLSSLFPPPEDVFVHRVVGEGQLGAPTDIEVASGVVSHKVAPPPIVAPRASRIAPPPGATHPILVRPTQIPRICPIVITVVCRVVVRGAVIVVNDSRFDCRVATVISRTKKKTSSSRRVLRSPRPSRSSH